MTYKELDEVFARNIEALEIARSEMYRRHDVVFQIIWEMNRIDDLIVFCNTGKYPE